MRWVAYVLAVWLIAARRLWYQRGLALCMLSGLVIAVGIATCVPIYADAVSSRILDDRLYRDRENASPPFSLLFRYVGSWSGYLEWEACRKLDGYLTVSAAPTLGLPQRRLVRHFKTDQLRLYPTSEAAYAGSSEPLSYVALGFISDLGSHIKILDGRFPRPVTNDGEPIEVLVTTDLVGELGIEVGEEYAVHYAERQDSGPAASNVVQRKVLVAGVWEALQPAEDFWFYPQSGFKDVFLMPEASYVWLAQSIEGEVGLALWSLVYDAAGVRSSDVSSLVSRIGVLRNKAQALLRDVDLVRSPEETLLDVGHTVLLLTVVLYVFSLPILALVLYFVSLVSGTLVRRQRQEIATLRSRGMTVRQVVGVYLIEGLAVMSIAAVLGPLVGERIARVMSLTRSFLSLDRSADLLDPRFWLDVPFSPTVFSWTNLRYGGLALLGALLASVLPAVDAARDTIVSHRQERSRSMRKPFWRRAFLDLLLLIPAGYGYYLLRQRGTISFLETSTQIGSPFSNPYLFVVPIVFVYGAGLLSIRAFPWAMRLLAWLANAWRGVAPVMALRHLARWSGHYTGPLLLLILTFALAVFAASTAKTLDAHVTHSVYYDVGADLRLVELGEHAQLEAGPGDPEGSASQAQRSAGPEWSFLPIAEHLLIPGVQHAARVWSQEVQVRLLDRRDQVTLVGIDRIDFPKVAFFRRDFAPASLGALMNALAVRDDAILISRGFQEHRLEVGDKIEVDIPVGTAPQVKFTVAGVVDYFPRLYPQDGMFLIANLDYIFNSVGGTYPYEVWLKAKSSLGAGAVADQGSKLGIKIHSAYSARQLVDQEQRRPERQGVYGLLSVGFLASAALTVLGFLIYSYVAFSRRYIELGVLRAIGLSVAQMALFLAAEQLILIGTGALVGTGVGILVSKLFIPFYQVKVGKYATVPPFVVQVAWVETSYIYAIFGVMFLGAVVVLLLSLRRLRAFEAVKLGETL